AVIPAERFEESVFGTADKPGLMRRADGGTLFLDELTAMPHDTQSKLLRAVETKTCEPIGGPPIAVELRVISATSQDPSAHMRQDLLFRLNTLMIDLPSLAERGDDILLLYRHYQARYSALYEVPVSDLSPADASALLTHAWPGNVRELQNVAERHVLMLKRGGGTVPEAIQGGEGAGLSNTMPAKLPDTLRGAVAVFERELIAKALLAHEGRMDDAASALGIGRRTLNEKIVKLGIAKDELFGSD
ncbi:MAG: sigma 54-interacting transcriptional regulator, partial [Pseudomonadota bacterium]